MQSYLKTLLGREVTVQYEQPSDLLYVFQGSVSDNTKTRSFSRKETISDLKTPPSPGARGLDSLGSKNLLLRGSVLRNTELVWGLVLYTGHETKIMMNSIKAKPKRSKLEEQLNRSG